MEALPVDDITIFSSGNPARRIDAGKTQIIAQPLPSDNKTLVQHARHRESWS
jgi:hypothetical protein